MECMLLLYDTNEKTLLSSYSVEEDTHEPLLLDIEEEEGSSVSTLLRQRFLDRYKVSIPTPTYLGVFENPSDTFDKTMVFSAVSDTVHLINKDGLDLITLKDLNTYNLEETLLAVLRIVEIDGLHNFKVYAS